jgi:toxin ParE1/3/4
MVQARFVKLRYTLPALADLNSVLDYIAAHSPQGARRVQGRIQTIIDLLLLYPGIGTRTDDPTIRRMTALPYPYVIFYEATEAEIIIHAIRHSSRDPSSMPGAHT